MSIIRRDEVLRDLLDLSCYIAQDSLEVAYRFLDAVEETFQDLERMPRMGTKREFQDARLSGVRMWRVKAFPKHLIFYRSIEDGVEIIRVLHSARDIESLFSDED